MLIGTQTSRKLSGVSRRSGQTTVFSRGRLVASCCGWDGAAFATPSPRFDECARVSPRIPCRPLRGSADGRRPGQSEAGELAARDLSATPGRSQPVLEAASAWPGQPARATSYPAAGRQGGYLLLRQSAPRVIL